MPHVIASVQQKGGVGKSTIARLVAAAYAQAGWRVLIADLDRKQMSSTDWVRRRNASEITPTIDAMPIKATSDGLRGRDYDLVIFDGSPYSDKETLAVSKVAQIVLIPTGVSVDDLQPAVLLANELVQAGVSPKKLCFVLSRLSTDAEETAAREYLGMTPYFVAKGSLPERPTYRAAMNTGRSVMETTVESLNERARVLIQSVIDRKNELEA